MLCWGVQGYFMKSANNYMSAEGIFFYMMIAGLVLIPVAWLLTDRSHPINWGWSGMTALIQVLNAIGALTLVYAFRYGKAIIVAPLSNAGAPLATAIISLIALGVMPGPLKIIALVLALAASVLLAIEPDAADEGLEAEPDPVTA
jgi:drug/metabolite transporter (DMT)-like permease